MPGKMTPAKEKYWGEAKKIVKDQTGKPQKKFKDINWGLTQLIYQNKIKKHLGKGKKKKKKADVLTDLLKFASFLDDYGHYELSDTVEEFVKEALMTLGVGNDGEE